MVSYEIALPSSLNTVMAEVTIPRQLFADILRLIEELRPPPDPILLEQVDFHAFQQKPRESFALMKTKATIIARNVAVSRVLKRGRPHCQGSALPMKRICPSLGFNNPVVGWMSVMVFCHQWESTYGYCSAIGL